MESRHLRYFLAIADAGSVTQASQWLGVAQPALSQSISRMEKDLGVKLLERSRRGAILTPAGQAIVDDVRLALLRIDQAEQKAQDIAAGRAGRLTVGLVSSSLVSVLPHALREIKRQAPGVKMVLREMSNAEQINALQTGEIDVGLLHTPVHIEGRMHEQLLQKDRLIAAVPNQFKTQKKGHISLAEITQLGLIMFPRTQLPIFNTQILNAFRQHGYNIDIVQEANRTLTVLACVAGETGVALLPSWITSLSFDGVQYCHIEEDNVLPSFNISVIWPARSTKNLADIFVRAAMPRTT